MDSTLHLLTSLPCCQAATVKQQPSGLGFYVPSSEAGGRGLSQLASLLSSSRDSSLENTIDHGSPYAKSLGFDAEIEWPIDGVDEVPIEQPRRLRQVRGPRVLSDGAERADCGDEDDDGGRGSCSSDDDGSLHSPEEDH
jgi:hypothetical protein